MHEEHLVSEQFGIDLPMYSPVCLEAKLTVALYSGHAKSCECHVSLRYSVWMQL